MLSLSQIQCAESKQCVIVCQCMHIKSLECMKRVGVPSSIRHSQQPFLVLDRAVRMHCLISPSFSSAWHAFFHRRIERWDLRGVFIHKDRWIGTKKGTLNIQNVTERVSGLGHSLRNPESHPLSQSRTSGTDTGTGLIVHNLAFYKNVTRPKLEQVLEAIP